MVPTIAVLLLLLCTSVGLSKAWIVKSPPLVHAGPSKRRALESCHGSRRSISSETSAGRELPRPPFAFRNETNFILAGAIDDTTVMRQSPYSPYPLLDPPQPVPDPYGWMRDDTRRNKTVLSHLEAENEYTRKMTEHLAPLREQLYSEFRPSTSETNPFYLTLRPCGKYWYYEKKEKGSENDLQFCRAPRELDDLYPPDVGKDWKGYGPLLPDEEIYLDLTRMPATIDIGATVISPNDEYVAYTLDRNGEEDCYYYVKHIASGSVHQLRERGKKMRGYGAIEWDGDSSGIFHVTKDEIKRPHGVYFRTLFNEKGHVIENAKKKKKTDLLLFDEKDASFSVHIEKSCDSKYLLILSHAAEASEMHYLDLQTKELPNAGNLRCVAPRRQGVLYFVSHCKGYWLIVTNVGSTSNYSLKVCRVGDDCSTWSDVILATTGDAFFDGSDQRSLDGIRIFYPDPGRNGSESPFAYGVAQGREGGLPRVWVLEFMEDGKSLVATKITRLEFSEAAFDVSICKSADPHLPYVVINYSSLVTPTSLIAVPLSNPTDSRAWKVLRTVKVPNYEKQMYACERSTVRSRDNQVDIPVSLVYRRDTLQGEAGNIPVHLFGYGSYGSSVSLSFDFARLSLLNRGIVYAIAHVRGGGEMNRQWFEPPLGAKYLCKKNSFNDFVDVANWLTNTSGVSKLDTCENFGEGMTNPAKLSIEGNSAGGLLVGAAMNQAPQLFRAAILEVPFVDVLASMIDATLPLTVQEWDQWGCPNEARYFQYIKDYSPINNVAYGQTYPACLITGGLFDPRVAYWEPAKFTAELRHGMASDSGNILLNINMEAGHSFRLKDKALKYAFILDELGLNKMHK